HALAPCGLGPGRVARRLRDPPQLPHRGRQRSQHLRSLRRAPLEPVALGEPGQKPVTVALGEPDRRQRDERIPVACLHQLLHVRRDLGGQPGPQPVTQSLRPYGVAHLQRRDARGLVALDLRQLPPTLRNWVRQDEADRGERDDRPSTDMVEENRRLARENAELRRVNEVLRAASAYFASEIGPTRRWS